MARDKSSRIRDDLSCILTSLRASQMRDVGWISGSSKKSFSSPNSSGKQWSPSSLLFSEYQGIFTQEKSNLTMHIYVTPPSRMGLTIPPRHLTSMGRCLIMHAENLTFWTNVRTFVYNDQLFYKCYVTV